MSSLRLTETSYIVLGLLEQAQPATPYDIKQLAQMSTVNFWALPHTQLYSECARLAREGLLSEEQEQTGRRRRIYRVTDSGREALDDWRAQPSRESYELRDVATLKLFFGADPATLAATQLEVHERRLRGCETLLANLTDAPQGWRLALECGLGHEREYIRFWSALTGGVSAPNGTEPAHSGTGPVPTGTGPATTGKKSALNGTDSAPTGKKSALNGTDSAPTGTKSALNGTDPLPVLATEQPRPARPRR